MNRLSTARRVQIASALVEGNSLRAASRMADVSINTVTKLLVDLGSACARYQDEHFRKLPCLRLECDEVWSFIYAKDKNLPEDMRGQAGVGSVWTWVAIDAETKLVPSWRVGPRDLATAYDFMYDLSERLSRRVQITTDGLKVYLEAIESAFGMDVDYAMLQKVYGADPDGEKRYSPAKILSSTTEVIKGEPNPKYISTSYIERQNLTMRMSMRRFTRLTNGFSKKVENHVAMLALHYMHYNFVRIHKTLRITPAMAAGVSEHVWSIDEIVGLMK